VADVHDTFPVLEPCRVDHGRAAVETVERDRGMSRYNGSGQKNWDGRDGRDGRAGRSPTVVSSMCLLRSVLTTERAYNGACLQQSVLTTERAYNGACLQWSVRMVK